MSNEKFQEMSSAMQHAATGFVFRAGLTTGVVRAWCGSAWRQTSCSGGLRTVNTTISAFEGPALAPLLDSFCC
jgi:hypothetical protein